MNPEDRLRELRDPDRWTGVRLPRVRGAGTRAHLPRTRLVPAIAAFVIAILAVAGLAVGLGSLHREATPAVSPSRTPRVVSSPSPAALLGVAAGPAHRYSAGDPPPACTLAQLQTVSTQDGGGAGGTYYQPIHIGNRGATCDLAAAAVRVGGAVATMGASGGLVLPASATATVRVATAEVCGPDGGTRNIDPSRLALSIALHLGDGDRTMAARFPASRCAKPFVDAELDPSTSAPFHPAIPGLTVQVDSPDARAAGTVTYGATLENTGAEAIVLTVCPTATEVMTGGNGILQTRELRVRCRIGGVLQPDDRVTLSVSVDLPATGFWDTAWFLSGGSATSAASTTCTMSQLRFSEPDPPGGTTGDVVQLIEVRNAGATCLVPSTAFAISGRTLRSSLAEDRDGIRLAAGTTTRLAVLVPDTCPDGSMNVKSFRSFGPDDKPIVVTLGSRSLVLPQPFPALHCAIPVYVDRV